MRDVYTDLLRGPAGPSFDANAAFLGNLGPASGAAAQRLMGGPGDSNGSTAGGLNPVDGLDPKSEPKEQKKARWESKLQGRLKELKDAHEKGDKEPVDKAMKSLKEDYSKARAESAELDPELEKAVKETLGESDGVDDLMGGLSDAFGGGGGDAGGGGGGGCDGGGCSGGGCSGGGGGGGGGGVNFSPPSVTPQDQEFLNQHVTTDPEHFKNQFGGWYQGSEGNCATVATIKAAMDRYDDKVFDQVNKNDNGYSVKLQDGDMVNLSNAELATARQMSSFRGNDPEALNYANLCYAVAAKRAQQFGNDGARDFRSACNSLNNGQDIYSPAKFLGLEKQMVRVNPRGLNDQDAVVGGSNTHAVFVNRNKDGTHTTDRYGRGQAYNGTDTWGNGLTDAYTFKPRDLPKLPSSLYTVTAKSTPPVSSASRSSSGNSSYSGGSSSASSGNSSYRSTSTAPSRTSTPARTTSTTPTTHTSPAPATTSSSTAAKK